MNLATEELNIDPIIPALNGGEDYELLFTVPLELNDKIQKLNGISIIGHITEKKTGCYLVPTEGEEVKIEAQGWSLNPGRYVGITDREEDDIDFAERLQELQDEFEVLTAEAHELEERIAENVTMLLQAHAEQVD